MNIFYLAPRSPPHIDEQKQSLPCQRNNFFVPTINRNRLCQKWRGRRISENMRVYAPSFLLDVALFRGGKKLHPYPGSRRTDATAASLSGVILDTCSCYRSWLHRSLNNFRSFRRSVLPRLFHSPAKSFCEAATTPPQQINPPHVLESSVHISRRDRDRPVGLRNYTGCFDDHAIQARRSCSLHRMTVPDLLEDLLGEEPSADVLPSWS